MLPGEPPPARYVAPVSSPCPFCDCAADRVLHETPTVRSLLDAFPLTDGHALVTPRRHVASLFALDADEIAAVWAEVGRLRADLAARLGVDAFNVGLNDGRDAGQTVGHAHVHLIPRRPGDVADPRGGVRWVIPTRAKYWGPA